MPYLGFLAQLNYPSLKARAYLHSQGVEVWENRHRTNMFSRFTMVVNRRPKESDFVLATVVTQPDKKDMYL